MSFSFQGDVALITAIIINDRGGFAFDFHFIRRSPTSAGKGRKHNFADLIQGCVKSFRDLGLKNRVQILIEESMDFLPGLQLDGYNKARAASPKRVRRNPFISI